MYINDVLVYPPPPRVKMTQKYEQDHPLTLQVTEMLMLEKRVTRTFERSSRGSGRED